MEKEFETLNPADKSPQPTAKDRLRIFMQYPGQRMLQKDIGECIFVGAIIPEYYADDGPEYCIWSFQKGQNHQHELESCALYLKSLGSISDEDKLELLKITNNVPNFGEGFAEEEKPKVIDILAHRVLYGSNWNRLPYNIADFLRSRGYALPYGKYSVDDLVEAGIYKLDK